MKLLKTLLVAMVPLWAATAGAASVKTLRSPDGTIVLRATMGRALSYSVSIDNHEVLSNCRIGMTVDGKQLGQNPRLARTTYATVNETLRPVVPLKSATVQNRCNVMTLALGAYSVEFRAYDSGVAYRFVTRMKDSIAVDDELMEMHFPGDYTADVSHVAGFKTSCETTYRHIRTADFKPTDEMTYLPIVISTDKQYRMLVSETDLRDYPGMFLRGTADNGMRATFPPCPTAFGPDGDRSVKLVSTAPYIARTLGTRTFPWRYVAIVRRDADLLLNQLTYVMASPCEVSDVSWIRPGQVSWDWWNHKMVWGVDFRAGINTATYKYYIDFAARYGVPYIILDEGWAKSTRDPYTSIKDIDIAELVSYGRARGVGIILWLPWLTVENHMELFARYEAWGVAGVKIDFMDRQDQWMVNYYERVAREAARHHLIVDYHGAYKPSGLERRYPNVLSYEGVRGMEQNQGTTPQNSIYLPFIRNAVGAMDFTPGAMSCSQPRYNRSTDPIPMGNGTRAYHMALFVVFESGVQMLCDSPTRYYAEPQCTEFITSVPTTWDETRVIDARMGQYVIVAKRKGTKWFVGAITGEHPQQLRLSLDFIGSGQHHIAYFEDGVNADRMAADYRRVEAQVDRSSTFDLRLAPNGGWCAVIE